MFLDWVIDVEQNERIVFVGLHILDCRCVLLRREVFAVGVLPQHTRAGGLFGELILKIIADGKLDPVLAFTEQKLKVEGDIDKALKLKEIIELKQKELKKSQRAAKAKETKTAAKEEKAAKAKAAKEAKTAAREEKTAKAKAVKETKPKTTRAKVVKEK